MRNIFKISEVEKLTGLSKRLIQFYVNEEVVRPEHGGGARGQTFYYTRRSLIEFGIIRQLATIGMTVKKIKKIVEQFRTLYPNNERREMQYEYAEKFSCLSFFFTLSSKNERSSENSTEKTKKNEDEVEVVCHPIERELVFESCPSTVMKEGLVPLPRVEGFDSSVVINLKKIVSQINEKIRILERSGINAL